MDGGIIVLICQFSKIKDDVKRLLGERALIPILGTGFSCSSRAFKGIVPTGEEFKEHMLNVLCKRRYKSVEEQQQLKSLMFSDIANLYETVEDISKDERRQYIRDNFWKVKLDDTRKKLLHINWPYIYTLNLDDGIEENSSFKQVICAFDDIDEKILDEAKCVIKLHGDVNRYLSSRGKIIFSKKAYIDSLQNNRALLNRVENDMVYQNIVYIGCSLSDELDLRITTKDIINSDTNYRFYFTTKEPTVLKRDELKAYGITHIVLFKDYDEIYWSLYELWQNKTVKSKGYLSDCKVKKVMQIKEYSDSVNNAYFFDGKSLLNDKREAILPYYFIRREISGRIVKEINAKNFVLIRGYSCTGKTYILMDVLRQLNNKEVYYLQSKELIHPGKLKALLGRKNICILADDMAFSNENLRYIIDNLSSLHDLNIHVLYAISYKNNEIFNIMQLLKSNNDTRMNYISDSMVIPKKLSKSETASINDRLNKCNIGTFFDDRTMVDNILNIANTVNVHSKYDNLVLNDLNKKQIAALVLLSIKKKVFVKECSDLDIYEEMKFYSDKLDPVIDEERTEDFERSPRYNSRSKFVLNGEMYLVKTLKNWVKPSNYDLVAEAYEYLIKQIVGDKLPTVDYSDTRPYRDFIMLDNINYLFGSKQRMDLIRKIYDKLQGMLASEPSYKHQRAKCEILAAKYTTDVSVKKEYYEQAENYVLGAIMIYQKRYSEKNNEKINISLQHAKYTRALIYCNLCMLDNYANVELNVKAIQMTYEAFLTSYNSFEYAGKDTVNYNKAIENMISDMIEMAANLPGEAKEQLEYLLNKKNEVLVQNKEMRWSGN